MSLTQTSDFDKQRISELASHIKAIIELVGEDPTREGLLKTPERAAKALWFLTSGYRTEPEQIVTQALFRNEGSDMVIVKDIEFYSMCEHHILPFFGHVSVGYIPDGKIVGLSKIARVVNAFARRLQVQERFTVQVADLLKEKLNARGVIVKCSGQHMCMKMRGVEKQSSSTVTVYCNGIFKESPELRAEFLNFSQKNLEN